MRIVSSTAVVVLNLFLVCATAWAQTSSLSGRVVDPQGRVVPAAEVTLLAAATQRSQSTRSGPDGTFRFDNLPPGEYVLMVQSPGFGRWTEQATVTAAPTEITATLQVGAISEDVTVQGALAGTAATGKTTLPIRELPITVHGVPEQIIHEQGANDLVTVLQNVSGVYPYTNYGVYEYYLFRGMFDSVQLVDGVRNEGNRINTQLANIERVEVLKGPSSALYGGGALGASVNLIRKKPSAAPAYEFSAAGGSWQTARGTFGATGRLAGESVLYRFDAGAESRQGYRQNDARRISVTPMVSWRISRSDQLNVYYTFNRDRFAGDAGIPLLNTDFGTPTPQSVFPDVPRNRRFNTPHDFAVSHDNNVQASYARQLSNSFGFRNTLSYRHFNDEYLLMEFMAVEPPDSVYRESLYFKHHRRPLTNLAELTGSFRLGLDQNLVVGWEGQRFHNYTHRTPGGGVIDVAPIDLFNPVETQPAIDVSLARIDYFTHNTNAFYFQNHITVTPQVKVLAGGRYDIFRRRSHNDPVVNGVQTEGPLLRREAEAFTGRAGLVYQIAPQLDLYGSIANSYKPLLQVQPDGSFLEPETGTQFEFGQRVHLYGQRVQLNTSVYRLLRENVPFSRPGGVFEQAGQVRSRGFEADVLAVPARQWRVNAGYGFTDAELLDYRVSLTRDLSGNTPRFVPRHSFNVWTAYDWEGGLGVNVGARYLSSVFAEDGNIVRLDGYGLVNLGVRYRHGRMEYALNVNNLTNTDYFASALYSSQLYPGEPINVLGTVRVRLR